MHKSRITIRSAAGAPRRRPHRATSHKRRHRGADVCIRCGPSDRQPIKKSTRVGKGIEPVGGKLKGRINKVIVIRLYQVVVGNPFEVVFKVAAVTVAMKGSVGWRSQTMVG